MTESGERNRSVMALAYEWSSRIVALSLLVGLSAYGGSWLDDQLGVAPVLLIMTTGLAAGAAFFALIRWTTPTGKFPGKGPYVSGREAPGERSSSRDSGGC